MPALGLVLAFLLGVLAHAAGWPWAAAASPHAPDCRPPTLLDGGIVRQHRHDRLHT